MIKHVVLFKFKPEASAGDRQRLVDGLNTLPGLIPEIKGWRLVPSVPGRPARFYHLALFADFEDVAAVDRYVAHPDHQKVVQIVDAVCEHRAAFNYED